MQSDREFFASHIPADGEPSAHIATIRRTPILNGYAAVQEYLREVRGITIGRPLLIRATGDGTLAFYRISGAYVFSADDVDAYVETLRVGGAA